MADQPKYEAQYRGIAGTGRMILKQIKKRIGGSSGMAAKTGRTMSGRQRQVDSAVNRSLDRQGLRDRTS